MPKDNEHKIKYLKMIASEQEFKSNTYGFKGMIDGIISVKDQNNEEKVTALEIKTGKYS